MSQVNAGGRIAWPGPFGDAVSQIVSGRDVEMPVVLELPSDLPDGDPQSLDSGELPGVFAGTHQSAVRFLPADLRSMRKRLTIAFQSVRHPQAKFASNSPSRSASQDQCDRARLPVPVSALGRRCTELRITRPEEAGGVVIGGKVRLDGDLFQSDVEGGAECRDAVEETQLRSAMADADGQRDVRGIGRWRITFGASTGPGGGWDGGRHERKPQSAISITWTSVPSDGMSSRR
jgi:hypothetical protein